MSFVVGEMLVLYQGWIWIYSTLIQISEICSNTAYFEDKQFDFFLFHI